MNTGAVAGQLGSFLADLRFLACFGALGLYGAWISVQRPGMVGMARLGLVVAFGATVIAYALSGVPPGTLPFTDFFLFVLLTMFLILEFMFQMSVLGVLVSGIGTLVAGLHYVWHPGATTFKAPNLAVAYWWLLRDLAVTTGVAALTLGLGTALVLFYMQGRRTGKLVHPNDLRDMVALLARGATPCFFFGWLFEVAALVQAGHATWGELWTVSWLTLMLAAAIAWLVQAERRRFSGRRVLGLIVGSGVALLAYSSERLLFSNLTGGPHFP
ncbi:MAG: hypothetical protein JWM80_2076 [Cyanobacteria bacterium RYN_339]|nr:hypothetical protein [Cyanobacteria bacterium RYN_339]